jgi:sugar lactone lactonase YvrE
VISRDELSLVADDLTWPEAPRWHDGELWFSDVSSFRLMRIGRDGSLGVACDVPGRPSGMGFMPDGRLLLATALGRELLWVSNNGATAVAADLGTMAKSLLNDMVVHQSGRAYVGDTGFKFGSDEPQRPGALLMFEQGRDASIVAEDVRFPNGMTISPDGSTLFLAETFGNRISAFDIAPNGELKNRRVHVELESSPDGLCLDTEGALWVPLIFKGEFQRVLPSGVVAERIGFDKERAISCVLGGPDRQTLFLGVAEVDESNPEDPQRIGALYCVRVPIPGSGIP